MNIDAAVVSLKSILSNAAGWSRNNFHLFPVYVRSLLKVCTIQQHSYLGSDKMKVHQITIYYWSFPLLVLFAAALEALLEALFVERCWHPGAVWPAVLKLFNQLCNWKAFWFFPPFTNTVHFVLQHQRPGAGRNNGRLQEPRETMAVPGPGKKASTWKNRESSRFNNTIGLIWKSLLRETRACGASAVCEDSIAQ